MWVDLVVVGEPGGQGTQGGLGIGAVTDADIVRPGMQERRLPDLRPRRAQARRGPGGQHRNKVETAVRITSIGFASLGNDFISANTSCGTARFFARSPVNWSSSGWRGSFPNQSR